jgi:DNA-binding transcriptional MerR regulator
MVAAMTAAFRASKPERAWTIRQLCREFGTTPRALRFYEDKGLLEPARAGQNRVYSGRDRARLQLILRGRRVGLSLAEIGELLALYDRQDGGATQMAASLVRFRAQAVTLRAQRDDLDAAISELESGCAWLEERLAAVAPDRLPQAEDYDQAIRARLEAAE